MGRPKGSKNKPKVNLETKQILPDSPLVKEIGQVVQYYLDGWRFGTLKGIEKGKAVIIHPTTGTCRIPLEDVNRYDRNID